MTQIILGVETATDACSVAISTEQQIFAQFIIAPQAHSKLILDMVRTVCEQAGVSLSQVQAFAYGMGPGSFTGLRIAASVIQGLAFGMGKPIIAVSSLQALAQQAYNKLSAPNILAILDARMQEIYCGSYLVNTHGLVESEMVDCMQNPESLSFVADVNYVAVGTGCKAYNNILSAKHQNLILDLSIEHPRAEEIVQLAIAKYANDEFLTPSEAVPAYLRNNVVQQGKKNPD